MTLFDFFDMLSMSSNCTLSIFNNRTNLTITCFDDFEFNSIVRDNNGRTTGILVDFNLYQFKDYVIKWINITSDGLMLSIE